jgi:hypothetical protein
VPNVFPGKEIGDYISNRTYVPYALSKSMLDDLDLVLNVIADGITPGIPQQRGWSLERDHIFPRSLLDHKSIYQDVDNVGNLRLVNKTRNILKSDSLPDTDLEFFGSDDPELKALFVKARQDLTMANFLNFVRRREELIFDKVKRFLGF